jgi:orotate phosphoribosyltransferase
LEEEKAMATDWNRLRDILRSTSFRCETEATIKLASGRYSRFYVDCKKALSYSEARALVGKLIVEGLKGRSFDAVGGLEIGAYPIATAVSDEIYRQKHLDARAFVVRKEAKGHGVGGLMAGDVRINDHVLIVDDVITTGKSTISAIDKAREAGLTVKHVVVLVDRDEEGGKQNIEDKGVTCTSLFTLSDLQEADSATANDPTYSTGFAQAKSA